MWKTYISDVRKEVDEESAAALKEDRREAERTMLVVVFTLMGVLFFLRFYGNSGRAIHLINLLDAVGFDLWAEDLKYALYRSDNARFNQRVFWAVSRIFAYFVIPMFVIRFVLKKRFSDFGLSFAGLGKSWRIYLLLAAIMTPIFFIASYGDAFQAKYPYYKLRAGESLWPWFIAWELLYAIQFAGLEFFYRGFLVHGMKRRFGYAAIWVMVIPYLTIHFGKPPSEALGSIFAGFILGTLCLKSRSIWWGVALHVWVACSMDFLSLWHNGHL